MGSLVTAMASFLDAKAHQGKWLLRIEDIDETRIVPEADQIIMQQLRALGMHWDADVIWQTHRITRYETIFKQLKSQHHIYGCNCSRKMLTSLSRNHWGEFVYTGHCRELNLTQARAWRCRLPDKIIRFQDRYAGVQTQHLGQEVGDMIVKRADGLFAYQLVVVVDDIDQGITHIVRGEDLLSSTARQIYLMNLLGHPYPHTLHVPLVLDEQGQKLSKQNRAPALDTQEPLKTLKKAWELLGFDAFETPHIESFWQTATTRWANRFSCLK